GGEERIEHAFELVLRNAVAIVSDADGYGVVHRAHRDANAGGRDAGNRVERVAHEVEHDLFQLNPRPHDPGVRRDILLDAYGRLLDVTLQQEYRALDRALYQDRLRSAGLAFAREGLEMTGD